MASHDTTTTPQQSNTATATPMSSDPAVPASSPIPSTQDVLSHIFPDPSKLPEAEVPTSQPPNPRLVALQAKRERLEATLADLKSQRAVLIADSKLPSGLDMPADWSEEQKTRQAMSTASGVIKEHIQLLHKYNEMKDIGLGLMGLIADKRGARVGTVMEEFGMGEKD